MHTLTVLLHTPDYILLISKLRLSVCSVCKFLKFYIRITHARIFSNNPKYVHNNAYFADDGHLNARGADEFTKDLIKELRGKRILNLNRNDRIH